MTKIAALGLGAMGARMTQRLIEAGHDVTVYNRTPDRRAPLTALGARAAESPRAAVADADVVMTILTDNDAARAVWLDEVNGIVTAIRPQTVALECSTVTPEWTQTLNRALRARDVALLDAPVVGSRPQAEAGQLVFLVGGPATALERVQPLLSTMGNAVHHVGGSGAGTAMKLAVNGLFGAQIAVLGELLGLLQKSGIAPEAAMSVLGTLAVTSPAAKGVGGLIAAGRHAPLFPIDLVEKDFRYASAAGAAVGAQTPLMDAVRAVYANAQASGHGSDNISGVAKLYLP